MVCFFGRDRIAFLPSLIVARNDWASNSRLFLEARRGIAVGVWRPIFVEPGTREAETYAPPLPPRLDTWYRP